MSTPFILLIGGVFARYNEGEYLIQEGGYMSPEKEFLEKLSPERDETGTEEQPAEPSDAPDETGGGEAPAEEAKLFTEEYVRELRQENKARRLENMRLRDELDALREKMRDLHSELSSAVRLEGTVDDSGIVEAVIERLRKADELLVYTAFSVEAANAGLSAGVISDAYRLADLDGVTVDFEAGVVTGVAEAVGKLLEEKPYLLSVRPTDIGSETSPPMRDTAYPLEIEKLAAELGVSPAFAAELTRKRSERVGDVRGIFELWRRPKAKKLSLLK
jgi:hypothetical protein